MSDTETTKNLFKCSYEAYEAQDKNYGWVLWCIMVIIFKSAAMPIKFVLRRPTTIGNLHIGPASIALAFLILLLFAGLPAQEANGMIKEEGHGIRSIFLWCLLLAFAVTLTSKIFNMLSHKNQVDPESSGVSLIALLITRKFFANKESTAEVQNYADLMRTASAEVAIPEGLHNVVRIGIEPAIVILLGMLLQATIDPVAGSYLVFSGACLSASEIRTLRYVISLREWKGRHA